MLRRTIYTFVLLTTFTLGACNSSQLMRNQPVQPDADTAGLNSASRKPNIILILADDLGFADVSAYGLQRMITPNIDRIGQQGARFEQAYVTTPVCSPSRAALLTGRYQQRFGFEYNAREAADVPDVGLIASELTIADHLKPAGYSTGVVGKWHLGFKDEHYPTNRGFDEFYGHLLGATSFINVRSEGVLSMPRNHALQERKPGDLRTDLVMHGTESKSPPNRRTGSRIMHGADKTYIEVSDYITDVFAEESVQFINRHKDEPFFLYAAFNAPHSPFQVTQKYYDRFPQVDNELQRIYFAMIAALDDGIGRILDTLDEHGIAENTLVVFLSDNGCAGYFQGLCSCEPLSGGKLTYYEGGIRVPFLMRWPQVIKANTTIEARISALDILPTVLAAAKQNAPGDLALDGQNLLPLFTANSGAANGRAATNEIHEEAFVWRNYPTVAVRSGNMKLIKPHQDRPGGFLYNLETDPREQDNIAAKHPDIVAALEAAIADWQSITREPLWTPRPPVTYSICNIEPIGFEN